MLRSLHRFFIVMGILSAIAAYMAAFSTPTRASDATPTPVPTNTPRPAVTMWPTWTPPPAPASFPTETPPPMPTAVYPPLAALPRVQALLDGSTSTQPLRALIACKAIGATCYWDSGYEERSIEIEPRYSQFVWRVIGSSGTHGSYVSLMEGKTDVILVARAPSEAEVKAAKEFSVTFDARPVALDALVFLANVRNPLNNLRLEDARSIYAGRITDWREVGGTPGLIKAYQREEESGSQELLKAVVVKDLPPINAPEMIVEGMGGPFNSLDVEPMGIAYSVYYYATTMYPDGQVKVLSIDGVQPTSATIADRTYPLAAEVYVAVRAGLPKDSPTLRVRDWLLSEAGQAVVKASGYVPVPPVRPANLVSSSRVQWAYKVMGDMLSNYPIQNSAILLDTQGKGGWEYIGDLLSTTTVTALFKQPSIGAEGWKYQFVTYDEVPQKANVLGKDGWDGVGSSWSGGQFFKRAESHTTAWEYQYQYIHPGRHSVTEIESILNGLGMEGWQVYDAYNGDISFRRPLLQPQEWRYEIVGANAGILDTWNGAIFAEEGMDGWEYVTSLGGIGYIEADDGIHYLFKRPSTNATPWEYKGVAVGGLLSGPPEALERFLNEQGQDGWELIDMTRFELFFRRPL